MATLYLGATPVDFGTEDGHPTIISATDPGPVVDGTVWIKPAGGTVAFYLRTAGAWSLL